MMGHYYETHEGVRNEFLGAIDLYTVGGDVRMIDNYVYTLDPQSCPGMEHVSVVGFENHSGRTYLGSGVQPLGRIVKGNGNNGEDGTEGVRYKNVFGTYSHGPVLPKNPAFCDYLLTTALSTKYGSVSLEPLGDGFENAAHDAVMHRVLHDEVKDA